LIVVRDAHYPGRAPIDAYGNGGFRFAGMSHRGSLLCLPSGIYGWSEPERIDEASLAAVFAEAASIEVLIVGTGRDIVLLPADLKARLRDAAIVAEAMSTGAASPGITITRMPILVRSNSRSANPCGMRMQPCDAGWPGSTPACNAIPDQVIRCMKGMEASS